MSFAQFSRYRDYVIRSIRFSCAMSLNWVGTGRCLNHFTCSRIQIWQLHLSTISFINTNLSTLHLPWYPSYVPCNYFVPFTRPTKLKCLLQSPRNDLLSLALRCLRGPGPARTERGCHHSPFAASRFTVMGNCSSTPVT